MSDKKRISFVIFLTFLVTSVMYITSFVMIPAFRNGLTGIRDSISGDNSDKELNGKIAEIDAYIEENYFNEYDKNKLNDMAVKGYVAGLGDKYSQYYTKSEYAELNADLEGNFKGVGVEVTIDDDNLITVLNAYKDAPAHKAGIQAGDKIIKVNGTPVNGDNYDTALNMMRGAGKYGKSDTVTVTIKRGEETFETKITREEITVQTVSSKMLENNIGYIQISSFGAETDEQFEKETNALITQGATSLIIDLRNNGGGMLESVVYVADYLLPEGIILTIKGKDKKPQEYTSSADCIDLPMCVLINGNSASASEVLAGALKDHKKATLIGEKTYGKGVVQTLFPLSDGDGLKITTAKYYTPSGECIDKKGIKPHKEVKMDLTKNLYLYTMEEDVQLGEAIKHLNGDK